MGSPLCSISRTNLHCRQPRFFGHSPKSSFLQMTRWIQGSSGLSECATVLPIDPVISSSADESSSFRFACVFVRLLHSQAETLMFSNGLSTPLRARDALVNTELSLESQSKRLHSEKPIVLSSAVVSSITTARPHDSTVSSSSSDSSTSTIMHDASIDAPRSHQSASVKPIPSSTWAARVQRPASGQSAPVVSSTIGVVSVKHSAPTTSSDALPGNKQSQRTNPQPAARNWAAAVAGAGPSTQLVCISTSICVFGTSSSDYFMYPW